MKKRIVLYYVFLITSVSVFAQTQTQIPHSVMDDFKQSHPNAFQAMWISDGANFKVSYLDESKMYNYKVYDSNSQLISHQIEVIGTSIPPSIANHYKKLNAIEGSYKVLKVLGRDGLPTFQVEYNNKITKFDNSGAILN